MRRGKLTTVSASELVEDLDVYPRARVDSVNVTSLLDAFTSGVELPPIVIESTTKRIVDGVHRTRMYQRVDPAMSVEVIPYTYDDDAELFQHAAMLNAGHGRRLSTQDYVRASLIGERLGIDPERMSAALSIPQSKFEELRVTRTAKDERSRPVPIKQGQRHLAGRKLRRNQIDAIQRSQGFNVKFYVVQLENALAGDLVDWTNEDDREALHRLFAEVLPMYADLFTPLGEPA